MNVRVVLVMARQDMVDLEELVLKPIGNHAGDIDPIQYRTPTNQRDAMSLLLNDDLTFDLAVVHLDLPRAPGQAVSRGAALGLDLVEELRRKKKDVPVLLLASTVAGRLITTCGELGNCYPVQLGVGFNERLREAMRQLLPGMPAAERGAGKAVAEIEIRLAPPSYRIRCRNAALPMDVSGTLEIDVRTIAGLVSRTAEVSTFEYPHWRRNLEEIGLTLFGSLSRSSEFAENLKSALKSVGGLEHVRFRFAVDPSNYAVALEALHGSVAVADGVFWMLKSSIVRTLGGRSMLGPATEPRGFAEAPVNTLIIEADASGFVDGIGYLPPLANVSVECQHLAGLIERRRREGGAFTEVVRLAPGRGTGNTGFAARVRDTLLSDTTWHLVHFSGHSFFDEDTGEGYVFLPERDSITPVKLAEFAKWLRRSCLLYLTSCRYSADSVVLQLMECENSIPAILGFRWDLDDEHAVHHAEAFYEELTSSGILEDAFVKARNGLFCRHETNRIWASPVLVLQTNECVDTALGANRNGWPGATVQNVA